MKLKIEVSNNAYNNAKHKESHSKNNAEIMFKTIWISIRPFDIPIWKDIE